MQTIARVSGTARAECGMPIARFLDKLHRPPAPLTPHSHSLPLFLVRLLRARAARINVIPCVHARISPRGNKKHTFSLTHLDDGASALERARLDSPSLLYRAKRTNRTREIFFRRVPLIVPADFPTVYVETKAKCVSNFRKAIYSREKRRISLDMCACTFNASVLAICARALAREHVRTRRTHTYAYTARSPRHRKSLETGRRASERERAAA